MSRTTHIGWSSPGPSESDWQAFEEKYKGLSMIESLRHPEYLNDAWGLAEKLEVPLHAFVLGQYYSSFGKYLDEASSIIEAWYANQSGQSRMKRF